ncbi:MAG TPA: cupin domain-containing protein [Alphaproteobacteria bacterium]|jgi:mannose-6-phosphate isomerase-like protein (cupin superfamily)
MSVEELAPVDDIGSFKNKGTRPDVTATPEKPVFFKLKAQMLEQGRTNIPLCKTDNMWGVLKVYASGGENALHTHTKEDHMFVVMQGSARFYGPNGEERDVGAHEGVLLPAHAYYWFHATSEEPLVLLRIGCKAGEGDLSERLNIRGEPMPGGHPDNKPVKPVFKDGEYFE